MATTTVDQNPMIGDTIVFDILTPDANGCFFANPYKVDSVTIFFIERDFSGGNIETYNANHVDPTIQAAYDAAKATACTSPTASNLAALQAAQMNLTNFTVSQPVYYNEASPIVVYGDANTFPAWLSSDVGNALITNVPTDSNGNPQFGHFQLEWQAINIREGDYVICWTYTPLPAGNSLSAYTPFYLGSNIATVNAIPTQYTAQDKYQILLERYLPEMFKTTICAGDLTPTVLDTFNNCIADSFTVLENLANQVVDLEDANAINASLLVLLGNLFNLNLKSTDPARWRRQIKQAVPLFKRKGTLAGLRTAMDQAGVKLHKLTRLWQVISPYTWQDGFIFNGANTFLLSKTVLPFDANNFLLSLRRVGTPQSTGDGGYLPLDPSYVSFSTTIGQTTMTWLGDANPTPVHLQDGDRLRVLYLINPIPNDIQQSIELYIRTLQLTDQRDETLQVFPPKNWNVRVLEEDDPLFDVIVPVRHPYADPLVFGLIRTEFPYSENVYMMEEYNGSLRASFNPCDIANDFLDPCGQCQGSKFSVDLEIQDLSNQRIVEVQSIITDYSPFHAVLHSLNFSGGRDDFIIPPIENIQIIVDIQGHEMMVAGDAQYNFDRAIPGGLTYAEVKRDMLASSELDVPPTFGTAYNDNVAIFAPDVDLDDIGVSLEGEAVLEILAPSANFGTYTITNPYKRTAIIPSGIPEPIDKSGFTFRLSNNVYTNTSAAIVQDNAVELTDATESFEMLGIKSQWDVDHGYAVSPWIVLIPAYSVNGYPILQVMPDGGLLLQNDGSLPGNAIASVAYSINTDQGQQVAISTDGNLQVTQRGRVELNDPILTDVSSLLRIPGIQSGWYLIYGGTQYPIISLVPDEPKEFYVGNYNLDTVMGVTVTIYQRLADNQLGYVRYIGMELDAGTNEEAALMINNGANPPPIVLENDRFKENFLVEINNQFYSIAAINGSLITLSGLQQDWQTLGAGGTPVNFSIYRFIKQPALIQGFQFDQIDRRGKELITNTTVLDPLMMAAFNMPGNTHVSDNITHGESINYKIEYADGTTKSGGI